jgi:hypothetical protein
MTISIKKRFLHKIMQGTFQTQRKKSTEQQNIVHTTFATIFAAILQIVI